MVVFEQSRCLFAAKAPAREISNKSKSRKTLTVVHDSTDPIEKLPSVEREKLSSIIKYKTALSHVVASVRDFYVKNLTNLVLGAVDQTPAVDSSLKGNASFIHGFAVRIPTNISDSAFPYTRIYDTLVEKYNATDFVVVRLKTLHTETLQLLLTEISKKLVKDDSYHVSCSYELLLKLLKLHSSSPYKLILVFENAEQIPIAVLSTAMQLFGQCPVVNVKIMCIFGVSSAESWHKLHTSLPLRATKNASFCFLSSGVNRADQNLIDKEIDVDVDFVENVLQEILLSEHFPLKFGALCTTEILTWLRDGRLSLAIVEKLFSFLAQNQIFKMMAEDSAHVVNELPGNSVRTDESEEASITSRQRSGEVNVRSTLFRLKPYWIDVRATCLVLRLIEETVLASSFQSLQSKMRLLDIYRLTLESNIAQTRWCSRLLMALGTISEDELDKLLAKLIEVLNSVKNETATLEMSEEQRPNLLRLLDICIDMRHQYDLQRNGKSDAVAKLGKTATLPPNVAPLVTPSASKTLPDKRKTMGLFGTPQATTMSYFDHQARLRAEIKANKGVEEDNSKLSVSTPGGSLKFGPRQFANQLRDWLIDWVPNRSRIINPEQNSLFYFDDLYHLASCFNPDMNELLSAGLSSKSIRQHMTLKLPPHSDFDVHILFSVFTSSSSVGSIATTAPLNQWYAAFAEARRLRRRKTDPPIDDKEMQARFVSALDELETRGLLRYNPPRRTITKLFECEEDDDIS